MLEKSSCAWSPGESPFSVTMNWPTQASKWDITSTKPGIERAVSQLRKCIVSGGCVTANVFGHDAFDRVCWDVISLSKEDRDQYDALVPLRHSLKEVTEDPLADDDNINHALRNIIHVADRAKVSVLTLYEFYV